MKDCIFCDMKPERVVLVNDLSYVVFDCYPVSNGHALIIPKAHRETYWDMTKEEKDSCFELMELSKKLIEKNYDDVDAWNLGMNCGKAAGQTIFHAHIHLIPRREGDTEKPRGGVRGVIPSRMGY